MNHKLTPAQQRALKWIRGGWTLYEFSGSNVEANGKRVCNTATMMVLERLDLVERTMIGNVKTWKRKEME